MLYSNLNVNAQMHLNVVDVCYVMCRYTVKVQEDHMVSLQLGTSKPDVYIKLQVKKNEDC